METKTSLQRDFEIADKPDERDLLGGTIIYLGKKFDVKTPVTGFIYVKLQLRKKI